VCRPSPRNVIGRLAPADRAPLSTCRRGSGMKKNDRHSPTIASTAPRHDERPVLYTPQLRPDSTGRDLSLCDPRTRTGVPPPCHWCSGRLREERRTRAMPWTYISGRSRSGRLPRSCAPISTHSLNSIRASATAAAATVRQACQPRATLVRVRQDGARAAISAHRSSLGDRFMRKALASDGLRPDRCGQFLRPLRHLTPTASSGRAHLKFEPAGPLPRWSRVDTDYTRREPYRQHPGADHHAAAGLVMKATSPVRADIMAARRE